MPSSGVNSGVRWLSTPATAAASNKISTDGITAPRSDCRPFVRLPYLFVPLCHVRSHLLGSKIKGNFLEFLLLLSQANGCWKSRKRSECASVVGRQVLPPLLYPNNYKVARNSQGLCSRDHVSLSQGHHDHLRIDPTVFC